MRLFKYVVLVSFGTIPALMTSACSTSPNTPVSSLQAACTAVKNKDVAAYRKVLSKNKLASMDETAEQSNLTTDELLRKYLDLISCPASPETGVGFINDNKATLTFKNPEDGEIDKYDFVKEDGVWKLN